MYYLKALRVKALIKKAFDSAFEKYDIILGPAAPTTAPELGKSLGDPLKMYLGDIYTISVNLAGLPGMSVPVGKDSKGLPIGMQLIGNVFQEKKLLRAAYAYECATEKQFERAAEMDMIYKNLKRTAGAGQDGRAGTAGQDDRAKEARQA